MIPESRQEFLTQQFVWSVQNNGEIFFTLKGHAERGHFADFRRLVSSAVTKLSKAGDEDFVLEPNERSFVFVELWRELGGPTNALDVLGTHGRELDYHMDRATADSYEQSRAAYSKYARCSNYGGKQPHERLMQEAKQHTETAQDYFNRVQAKLNEMEKENQMSQIAFQTKSYVYGQDVSTMTEEQLIDSIRKIEDEVSKLNTVKTKSKKLDAKKEELTAMLANVVEILDAK